MRSVGRRYAVPLLFVFAVGVRLAVVMGGLALSDRHIVDLAMLHDGREYQEVAAAITSIDDLRELRPAVRRMFPGYPVLIRTLSTVLPMPLASIVVAILAAAAAVVLLHRIGVEHRTCATFAVITPSWLVFTSSAMSEGPFLALVLAGFLLWLGHRRKTASLVLGAATLVRPVGLLVFLALWVLELRGRSHRKNLRDLMTYSLLPVAWSVISWVVWRDPAHQVNSYIRRDFTWPLHNLTVHLLDPIGDPLKWLQTSASLGLTAVAAILLYRRFRATADRLYLRCLLWLAGMATFHVFLPSTWVFECLPRFMVGWLPPIMIAVGPHLPRARWFLALATCSSMALSIYWMVRALAP